MNYIFCFECLKIDAGGKLSNVVVFIVWGGGGSNSIDVFK